MTPLIPSAAAASGVPPVAPVARPAFALFDGWSPEMTVVALFVAGVALVFLSGVLVGDLVRLLKGRR